MKKRLLFLIFVLWTAANLNKSSAQTQLLSNGSFEANPWFQNWSSILGGMNIYGGPGGPCTASNGSTYMWCSDLSQVTGLDNLNEIIGQSIYIPNTASACSLLFDVNISTADGTSTVYDSLVVGFRNSSGGVVASWYLSNMNATSTVISNCGSWIPYSINIPPGIFGQNLTLFIKFYTDNLYPTIFRVDNMSLLSYASCSYGLSNNSYTCPNSNAAFYNSISSVITQSGCPWSAIVTSGNSWLSTSSSGNGSGPVSINVTANNNSTPRTGTISVAGQTLVITQPGINCNYILSQNSFTCPNSFGNNYSNIASVFTNNGCTWTSVVTSGNSWLSTSSSGNGNGSISITTVQNSGSSARVGTIDVAGQTITVIQPGVSCVYALSNNTFALTNNQPGTFFSIANLNTNAGCSWSAVVVSGNSWLSTNSSGNASGPVNISVAGNFTGSIRTGIIDIAGETLVIIQPGSATGIKENVEEGSLSIFPNPVKGRLYVRGSIRNIGEQFLISDLTGKAARIDFVESENMDLDVSSLSSGSYIFRIIGSEIPPVLFMKE